MAVSIIVHCLFCDGIFRHGFVVHGVCIKGGQGDGWKGGILCPQILFGMQGHMSIKQPMRYGVEFILFSFC